MTMLVTKMQDAAFKTLFPTKKKAEPKRPPIDYDAFWSNLRKN